jgi:hypothetical protein
MSNISLKTCSERLQIVQYVSPGDSFNTAFVKRAAICLDHRIGVIPSAVPCYSLTFSNGTSFSLNPQDFVKIRSSSRQPSPPCLKHCLTAPNTRREVSSFSKTAPSAPFFFRAGSCINLTKIPRSESWAAAATGSFICNLVSHGNNFATFHSTLLRNRVPFVPTFHGPLLPLLLR